jgi:hypothetical protein
MTTQQTFALVTSTWWDKKYTTLDRLNKGVQAGVVTVDKFPKVGSNGEEYGTWSIYKNLEGKTILNYYCDNHFFPDLDAQRELQNL